MVINRKSLGLALTILTIPVLALATCSILINSPSLIGFGDAVPMEINGTSNKNQLKTGTASSTPYSGSASIQTERGNSIGIDYSNILITEGAWQAVQVDGYFTNTTSLHGLSSMVITAADNTANLGIYWSGDTTFSSSSYSVYNSSSNLTMTCSFNSENPNYFKVVGLGSANSSIESIKISFSCENSYSLLTVSSSDTSKGTASGSGAYYIGSNVSVTATPLDGYSFVGWYNGDTLVSSDNPYTFIMPNSDYSLTAQFRTPIAGDSVLFGSYPQTKVTDTDLIATLNTGAGTLPTAENAQGWSDYGYYISDSISSYMWFTDITVNSIQYRGVYFTSYRPCLTSFSSTLDNSKQDEYGYDLSTTYWFKFEPLSWRVLIIDSGKYYLMSNLAIDAQDYFYSEGDRTIDGSTVYANNYQYSHIRSWLNGYTDQGATNSYSFFNTAFNATEKDKIQTRSLNNGASTTCCNPNPYASNAWTEDKLFLLCYTETNKTAYGFNSSYLSDDTKRQFIPTDYCKCQGVYAYTGYCGGWTRSPSNEYPMIAQNMGPTGQVEVSSVDDPSVGVVPVMYVAF